MPDNKCEDCTFSPSEDVTCDMCAGGDNFTPVTEPVDAGGLDSPTPNKVVSDAEAFTRIFDGGLDLYYGAEFEDRVDLKPDSKREAITVKLARELIGHTTALITALKDTEMERDELAYVVKKFGEWHNENRCPATETKEGFCPDPDGCREEYEKEQLELDEEDRFDFDPSDCETQYNCGVCYAEYYKKLFRALRKDGKQDD